MATKLPMTPAALIRLGEIEHWHGSQFRQHVEWLSEQICRRLDLPVITTLHLNAALAYFKEMIR